MALVCPIQAFVSFLVIYSLVPAQSLISYQHKHATLSGLTVFGHNSFEYISTFAQFPVYPFLEVGGMRKETAASGGSGACKQIRASRCLHVSCGSRTSSMAV